MKMQEKNKTSLPMVLFIMVMAASSFRGSCSSLATTTLEAAATGLAFPLKGNIYPLGYYTVSVIIGNPAKAYNLEIDTETDLTWVRCDAPSNETTKPRDQVYKRSNDPVLCEDPLCSVIMSTEGNGNAENCENPDDECRYKIKDTDDESSYNSGVLVADYLALNLTNGNAPPMPPRLVFGCQYDDGDDDEDEPGGVLGLGHGKISIVSQLRNQRLTKNVFGHCLSRRGGGYLFFGDELLPSSGVTWTSMSMDPADEYYSSEAEAEILFSESSSTNGIKGLKITFDSTNSYIYFNDRVYGLVLDQIKQDLPGSLEEVQNVEQFSVCWKSEDQPFESIKGYFKPLIIRLGNTHNNVQLHLLPEDYLIVIANGNVCLGILNGNDEGFGSKNVIGNLFMQDKMMIYDNEKRRIGWIPTNCDGSAGPMTLGLQKSRELEDLVLLKSQTRDQEKIAIDQITETMLTHDGRFNTDKKIIDMVTTDHSEVITSWGVSIGEASSFLDELSNFGLSAENSDNMGDSALPSSSQMEIRSADQIIKAALLQSKETYFSTLENIEQFEHSLVVLSTASCSASSKLTLEDAANRVRKLKNTLPSALNQISSEHQLRQSHTEKQQQLDIVLENKGYEVDTTRKKIENLAKEELEVTAQINALQVSLKRIHKSMNELAQKLATTTVEAKALLKERKQHHHELIQMDHKSVKSQQIISELDFILALVKNARKQTPFSTCQKCCGLLG